MPHRPRKRFSQNFLTDRDAVGAIIRAMSPTACDLVVEIGPGLGALTGPLLESVGRLHAVEIDRDLVRALRDRYPADRLIVHEGDVLQFDYAALGHDIRVVGNLPYHISTPILFHLAGSARVLRDAHVMLQSELVDRLVAPPASPEYGRVSVMLQYRFGVEKVLDVPLHAFRPPPKVNSAVIRLVPRGESAPRARDETLFAATVALAFSQRRKTLRNTLGRILPLSAFDALGIDPGARAQTLPVEDYVRIADYRACANDA